MKRLLCIFALFSTLGCGGAEPKPDATPDRVDYEHAPHLEERARDLTPVSRVPENVLIENATLYTAAGEVIEGGSIWLRDGVIVAIGKDLEAIDAAVVDADGRFVTPGLIDTHSHLGVYPSPSVEAHWDGNEATRPATAHLDALYSVWPQDPGFYRALAGGITVLQILPGSANLIGGRSATLALHPGVSARAMVLEEAPVGIKMACGENPKRVYGQRNQSPSTRMGSRAGFRDELQKAREALEEQRRFELAMGKWLAEDEPDESDRPKEPSRDFGVETLMAVLDGELVVHVHCYRADEMVQILELADEFGFEVRSFHHAVEAYKIRDILAAWDVSVSTWADWWGFKIEAHDAIVHNAALLHDAGARAVIHSDSSTGIQRLNQEAAKAMWAGRHAGLEISEEDALTWITLNPAWALGIDDITGSLVEGKRADVVLWDQDPFSIYAQADVVWVGGVREYDRSEPAPWSDFEVYTLPEEAQ